ncbi:snRNA transcription by RNA polymerase III [Mactra antiquata]
MDNLLDDIDGLVPPGLSTETPDWCVNCQSLRQEVKTLKEEHCQNFSRLKQKIINTEQCEILETQLKAALLDTEPLRKVKVTLEEELKVKQSEHQTLSDKLLATEGMQRQYEHLAKTNIASVDKLEAEKKELTKKIKSLELGKVSKEVVKELKNEISNLKKENSSLKKDITSLKNKEEKLELKLQIANNNIDDLNITLKDKGMSPRGRRRTSPVKSPFHSPKIGRYKSPTKSPAANKRKQTFSSTQNFDVQSAPREEKLDTSDASSLDDTDDDTNSIHSIGWTFSPLKPCISPLPPSPACFTHQNDTDGECSDIADDLEQLLDDDNEFDNNDLKNTVDLENIVDLENTGDLENAGDLEDTDDLDNTGNLGNTGDLENTFKNSNGEQAEDAKAIGYVHKDEIMESLKDESPEFVDNIDDGIQYADGCHDNNISDTDDNKLVKLSSEQTNTLEKDKIEITEKEKRSREIIHSEKAGPIVDDTEKAGPTVEKDSAKTGLNVDIDLDKGNSETSVEENINGAKDVVSPLLLKKSSSQFKTRVESESDTDDIKTVSKPPAIRRSARIRSQRDSEASEVESDSNLDKTYKNKKSTDIKATVYETQVTDKIHGFETTFKGTVDNSEVNVNETECKRTEGELNINLDETFNCDMDKAIFNEQGALLKSETSEMECDGIVCKTDLNKNDSKIQGKAVEQKSANKLDKFEEKRNNEELNTEYNSTEPEDENFTDNSSDKINEQMSSNTIMVDQLCENTGNKKDLVKISQTTNINMLKRNENMKTETVTSIKSSEVKEGLKSTSDESLRTQNIEVFEEMQTEPVVPKPVPGRSCLLRQEAVSNTLRHSHLFEDLQCNKDKRLEASIKSRSKEKFKSKFGAHKFISFQPSSAVTLSNEIDDLNYSQDYDILSRDQKDDTDIKKSGLGSKYKKNVRRKMRKKCKYRDLDSVQMISNSEIDESGRTENVVNSNNTSTEPTKSRIECSAYSVDSKTSKVSPAIKTDKNVSKELKKSEKEENEHGAYDENCDKVETMKKGSNVGNTKDSVTKCGSAKSVASDVALNKQESVNMPVESIDSDITENEKYAPSRQLSTGFLFSGKTASIERTSSTESGMSIRGSPIKLCLSESGSCDTILEDVNENVKSNIRMITDKSGDNYGNGIDKSDSKIILGVEDIMDNEHDEINDTVDKIPDFLMQKDTDVNNGTSYIETNIGASSSFESSLHDAQPGCSKCDTHLKSHVKDLHSEDVEHHSHSENIEEDFVNDDDECSRGSTASFGVLGRCSPFSDMFLSRFEVFNPVSPLPPSPVRELEEEDECGLEEEGVLEIVEDIESDDKLVIIDKVEADTDQGKNETLCNKTTNEILHTNRTKRKAPKKPLSHKSVVKQSLSASSDIKVKKTNNTSDNVVKCNKTNISVSGSPRMTGIKVEELKLSPLPQMISPLKPLSGLQSKIKMEKGIVKGKSKRLSDIGSESSVKTEILDNTVITRTRSKSSISKLKNEISAIKVGSRVTRKQNSSVLPNPESSGNSNVDKHPVRESALVKKILRKRAEVGKNMITSSIDTESGHDIGTDMNKMPDNKMSEKIIQIETNKKVVQNETIDKVVPLKETNKKTVLKDNQSSVEHVKDNENREKNEEIVPRIDEKGDHNVLEELPTGHDNLAFKRKTRVAHKPNVQPLKPQKIQIIDAPHLPQVKPGRKRKSTEGINNDGQDKKPCKQKSFSKQTNDTCISKVETKRMQTFLKSTESADSFLVKVIDEYGQDHVGNILLLTCFECLGRVRTDPLDVVYENCLTDTYLSIDTEFPFLSDVEKRAIYLICYLLDHKYIKKDQLMKSAWDTVLCRNLTVNVIGKMTQCRLFIALCAEQGNLELARTMFDQLVRSKHINFLLFIVPVVSVWPEILRKNPADCPDEVVTHGFILVLEELITERLLAMEDTLSKKVLHILKKLCLWSGVSGNSEIVLKTLFIKLQTCTEMEHSTTDIAFEITNAVNLLCASKPWPWVKVNFIERHGLQTGVNKYLAKLIMKRPSSNYMCALLKMTSHILNIHASTIRERDYQQIIRNWLLPVLKHKSNDDEVSMCCLETLIELTPLYPTCLQHVHGWFQDVQRNVSDEMVTRLEDLRLQYKQHFGLTCKPFVKS